jgi:phage shock protein PspC (stress-responsive transcriptional regulator)
MIGGVAAGMARYFGMDIAISRIIWGILLFAGVGLPAYLICWVAMPRQPVFDEETITIETMPRRSRFGTLVRIAFLLTAGAVIASQFDPDVSIAAFLVGLGFGLYYVWRNRTDDDERSVLGASGLHRSDTNRRIFGVFGGLGESLGADATILRIVGAILLVAGFPVVIPIYLLYAAIVPARRAIVI